MVVRRGKVYERHMSEENSPDEVDVNDVDSLTDIDIPPVDPKAIAIIGGGPAGLIAAERLIIQGHQVILYDRMPTLGRKFLMAGRGGLNLTHSEAQQPFMARYRDAEKWLGPIIAELTPGDLREWCEDLGQETFVGSSGRVFPDAMKASPLLRAWIARLEDQGVQFKKRHAWTGWNDEGALTFDGADGPVVGEPVDIVILALGGASWPKLGSDGGWASVLEARGVEMTPFEASNCGVNVSWSDVLIEKFAGHPLKGIGISIGDEQVRGEAMITQYGLEGGGIYALSAAIRAGLKSDDGLTLSIDLRPHQSVEKIAERLSSIRKGQSLGNMLKKAVKLAPHAISLLREVCDDIPRDPMELANLIKAVPIKVDSLRPIDRAISSAGGIKLDQIDDNLMLKAIPGVFVAGEMLDWEAPTGGYLLQASFSTGAYAALGVADWLSEEAH
jgi:uncharacterized flavoprotein (TIGR03862 family)